MDFQNDNDHFIVSQELIELMQRIIEEYSEDLKTLIDKSLPAKSNTQQPFDAHEAQNAILDFLTMMEVLTYESKNENEVDKQLKKQLMPSIDHIDRTSCDSETVDSSIENATQEFEDNPQANPQEILYKELLKQWKPPKKAPLH